MVAEQQTIDAARKKGGKADVDYETGMYVFFYIFVEETTRHSHTNYMHTH